MSVLKTLHFPICGQTWQNFHLHPVSGCGPKFARNVFFVGGHLGLVVFLLGATSLGPKPSLLWLFFCVFFFWFVFVCFSCFENSCQCLPLFLICLPFSLSLSLSISLSLYLSLSLSIYIYINNLSPSLSLSLSASFISFFLPCCFLAFLFGGLFFWPFFASVSSNEFWGLLLFYEMNNFKPLNLKRFLASIPFCFFWGGGSEAPHHLTLKPSIL